MNCHNICSTTGGIQGGDEGKGYSCSSGFASLDSVDSLGLQNDLKNSNDDQPITCISIPFQVVNEPQMNPFQYVNHQQHHKYSTPTPAEFKKQNFPTGSNYEECKENQPNHYYQYQNPQCNQQGQELMPYVNIGYNYFNNHPEIPCGGVQYCVQPEALKCQNVQELFIPFQIIQGQGDKGQTTSTLGYGYKDRNPIPLRKKPVSTTDTNNNNYSYYHHKSPFCSTVTSKSQINGFDLPSEAKKRAKSKVFLVRDYSVKRRIEPQVKFVSYSEELLERKLNEYAFERSQNHGHANATATTTTTATPSTPASNIETYYTNTSNRSQSSSKSASSSSSSG